MILRNFAACIPCLLYSGPLLADLTADDLWTAWQQLAETREQDLSATRIEPTADGLVLHGLHLELRLADGTVATTTLDQVTLEQQGDEVGIHWPPAVAFRTRSGGAGAMADAVTLGTGEITLDDAAVTAFGAPGDIGYRFDIAAAALSFVAEEPRGDQAVRLELTAEAAQLLGQASNLLQATDTPAAASISIAEAAWSTDLTAEDGRLSGTGQHGHAGHHDQFHPRRGDRFRHRPERHRHGGAEPARL